MRLVLHGRVTPDERLRDPYLELPFDVPDGAEAVEVRYRHDAGSVLDLGLADPHLGPFPSREGFRGWSGGARDHVMLTRTRATPGYLAGPLPAGRWRVLLGLAAVADAGCSYRVEVTAHLRHAPADVPGLTATPGVDDQPSPATPPRDAPGWYRADLQSHSHHSDARGSLHDLRAMALVRGLDVLAVTDHNTVSHHAPMAALASPGMLWLPGMEVTTYRGHANVWGVDGWVDFRIRSQADIDTLIEHVHARGGLFSVNHPKASPGCIGCDWEYAIPAGIDCLEAWQGPWFLRNWESLERYDALLREGRRVTLVGGSDRHQPPLPDDDPPPLQLGSPTTWLWLETHSRAGVLDALRKGFVSVSEQPDGPFVSIAVGRTSMGGRSHGSEEQRARALVQRGAGERLRWIGAAGVLREVTIDHDRCEDSWTLPDVGPFVRAEVVAATSLAARREALERGARERGLPQGLHPAAPFRQPYRLALSNPVYLGA